MAALTAWGKREYKFIKKHLARLSFSGESNQNLDLFSNDARWYKVKSTPDGAPTALIELERRGEL